MDQVQMALIAIALVLSAVFLPMAFFGGSTGVIYRQFSITIVSSMVLSVIVALVLSPALTATLLKPPKRERRPEEGEEVREAARPTAARRAAAWFRRAGERFNLWFTATSARYRRG